ncbi:Pectin lyase-like superfamily protein [Perilla frutescens var. hirtella]|nr:Pectin lyase-like superfamily protein [Perilla frutescens var. frutescens]KAH6784451.1 Pectin lyase-like superfamily protein [Perilla frutescens var. hirtella]
MPLSMMGNASLVGLWFPDLTLAFQNVIFYLKSFADKGGAQLYVPAGKWLIGCITLTSHLTLFLEKDVVVEVIEWT